MLQFFVLNHILLHLLNKIEQKLCLTCEINY